MPRGRRIRCVQPVICAAAACAIGLGLAAGVATGIGTTFAATDPHVVLIDDVGEGFVADAPVDGPLGSQTRTYRHAFGELTLQGNVLPKGLSAATFIDAYAASVGTDLPEVPVRSVLGGRAFQVGDSGGVQASSLIFASADAVFLATLRTDPGATWIPIEFLERLASIQIRQSGGPATLTPAAPIDPELAQFLPKVDDNAGRFVLVSEFGGNEDLSDDLAANSRLVDFLSRNTLVASQLWSTTDGNVLLGVSATRYPYERFAAAVLGEVLHGDVKATRIEGVSGRVKDAVVFQGTGVRANQLGVAFRRGRFTFVTLADQNDDQTRRALVEFVQQLAAGAPNGASDAQPLPSSRRSVVLSTLLVVGFGVVMILIRLRLTRRATAEEPVRPPGEIAVRDVSEDARTLRRGAVMLSAVQVATSAVAIVGFAADAPTIVRLVIVGGAVGTGLAATAWWRRRELGMVGAAPLPWRPSVPEAGGIVLHLAGMAMFIAGLAAVIWGLRELVFTPSLTHLQWCDRLRMSPKALALLIALVGVIITLTATAVLRLARARGRSGAERTRHRDPRPPVLYLRSFNDDDVALPCVLSARRPFLELFTLRTTDPFEESLAWELSTYGPVTAVGRPGGSTHTLGAARELFTDETWQGHVVERMSNARSIAVVIGETPGLEWEIETIARHGFLDKTLFLMPPGEADDQRRRWQFMQAGLPEDLRPADLDLSSILSFQIIGGVVAVTVSDRRDEAAYRVAVDYSMSGSPRQMADR
jgi:hypothetical protein